MITYVNSANTAQYRALFDKANNALNLTGTDSITTLEEYFAHITELATLDVNDVNNSSVKYTILPLDEEVFEIDANTRTITVPPSFKKNGISVQGDEIAEILYFKIDRYFDTTDLNTKDIYIQWENAPDSHGVSEKNVSIPWVKDIVSEPDKIIFGWPISSEITGRSGTIKFSVRFVSWDTTQNPPVLTYSFSTLTASAVVSPGLDLDIDEPGAIDIINHNTLILNRLTNTNPIGGQIAQDPQLFINLDSSINLEGEIPNQSKRLEIQADSTDAGIINVEWKRYQNGVDTTLDNSGHSVLNPVIDYVLSDDVTFVTGKTYYIKNSTVPVSYEAAVVENGAALPTPNIYYEKIFACTVSTTGVYYAVVTNRVHHSYASIESAHCTVPEPVAATLESFPSSKVFIDGHAELSIIASSSDNGILSYQWYKGAAPIENATLNHYDIMADLAAEAQYTVNVSNSLNNSTTTIQPETPCRVTYPANTPDIASPVFGSSNNRYLANGVCTLSVALNEVSSDKYSCQWYEYIGSADPDHEYPGPNDILLASYDVTDNSNLLSYDVTRTGDYYVKIINYRNNTTSTPAISGQFHVGN